MTRHNIDDLIWDFTRELSVIKDYRKQIGHPEEHLKAEVRRIDKLAKELRVIVAHLKGVRKHFE